MQTVPSLIGAGTAVAAAATGLVFGELPDGQPTLHPDSSKRKSIISDRDFLSVFSSRPGTTNSTATAPPKNDFVQDSNQQSSSSNATTRPRIPRRSSHIHITPPKSSGARHSAAKQGEFSPATPIAEDARDSLSSSSSWIRRLSIRPLSQHESIRSSVGPDSPSITFSHGSAAPILSPGGHPPAQLPPNKLVKRASAANGSNAGPIVRRGSKAQMTLRRPATSHQRSATLNQQINPEELPTLTKVSFDRQSRPRAQTLASPTESVFPAPGRKSSPWKSFWHSRLSRSTVKSSPLRSNDTTALPGVKRICVEQPGRRRAFLVAPSLLMGTSILEVPDDISHEQESQSNTETSPQTSEKSSVSPEATPSKQPRRSISMHFSSPSSWVSKTGSLRRRKRGETMGGSKRHVSAPATTGTESIPADAADREETSKDTRELDATEAESNALVRLPTRTRNSSSPLPPISRLSSFHIDLNKIGTLSTGYYAPSEISTTNSIAGPRVVSNTSQARTLDRTSTTASSEYHRGFTSGEDDDTDFKTDTPFDSIRTAASGRRRTLDSPLESMFDESPPSTAGNNSKPKRLSIQEILGPSFNDGNKIMEEDENLATPIRGAYAVAGARFRTADIGDEDGFDSNPASPNFTTQRDVTRFSFDDDDDDLDWDNEEENGICNHLSPPSSMNSRKGSPNSRTALGYSNGNAKVNMRVNARTDPARERPRSTVFDWTESVAHEKHDLNGSYTRPKTVHGKQEMDVRGGRSASRKGPIPAHVRSQSVPVVPDQSETTAPTPKFGTWGLGQKNASEDWDDDFEFEEEESFGLVSGDHEEPRFSMVVPASIQATQPTIRAHSGQIRELSLLVNDLKRLCRLGREMDMLSGSAKLWREAEGIIALASPDDDPTESVNSRHNSQTDLVDERFIDQGFNGANLDDHGSPKVTGNQRNAVVRDRPAGRRRSVFAPDDDIFGTWDHTDEEQLPDPPKTPENRAGKPEFGSTSVARSVMEAMHPRQVKLNVPYEDNEPPGKLNFDTNSLKELVKRASDLRDGLSDLVRKADHLTQSPVRTPKHTRADGSPAFTRVFDEPTTSPTRRLPNSHSNTSVISNGSVGASPSNGISQRMQMMTVS
ncbi:uncharacterized protein GGS22DRAFT_89805 [Annulohypoxylon maeteangense]|uniref:uncharacterized protein n=1 Tax=Annulohypoxylon maeteangense TaxID=1927788 RepID=UPI00200802A7|nr:uncharacterized protein GGS22DRAFT_89805 [Annulohypoxylon maeteangense]KAI0887835.1 hypothetical protein GGS22DRAFT_89805 [Annulohypoxylon maeteangense]